MIVPDAPREYEAEVLRMVQTQQAVLVRIDRVERDLNEHDRQVATAHEKIDRVAAEIHKKLDALRGWVIGALLALIINLLVFVAGNLPKILGFPAPR